MAPNETSRKSKKNEEIGEEAETLQKYLKLKKTNVPSLKNLTDRSYGRPAEKHNPSKFC